MAGLQTKSKVVIMFASPYSMPREDGTILEGLSVEYYFFGDHGEAIKPTFDADSGVSGIRRSKCSLDVAQKDRISYVPGVYDADFGMKVGSDGKPILTMQSIDFVGKCIMSLELDPAAEDPVATPAGTAVEDPTSAPSGQPAENQASAAEDHAAQDLPKKSKK